MKQVSTITRSVLILIIFTLSSTLSAQVLLLNESFDSPPVTTFYNPGDANLITGPSPCGKVSNADASVHNSLNVDFNNAQNPTPFAAVNPEDSCGGFYTASMRTDSMDFSGMDTINLSAGYFISSTLGWGATTLNFVFDNGVTADTVQGIFTTTDSWSPANFILPPAAHSSHVVMHINMGGGEGVAVDDIIISGQPATMSVESNPIANMHLYPNPASSFVIAQFDNENIDHISIFDISGRQILNQTNMGLINQIDISVIPPGIYMVNAYDKTGNYSTQRLIVN